MKRSTQCMLEGTRQNAAARALQRRALQRRALHDRSRRRMHGRERSVREHTRRWDAEQRRRVCSSDVVNLGANFRALASLRVVEGELGSLETVNDLRVTGNPALPLDGFETVRAFSSQLSPDVPLQVQP